MCKAPWRKQRLNSVEEKNLKTKNLESKDPEEKMSSRVKNKVKQRGRSIFSRIFFSRTMITLLLVLLQLWLIVAAVFWLNPYSTYIYYTSIVISALLIVYVTNCNIKTEFKLVWMLPLCAVPALGVLLYLFVLVNPGSIGLKKQLQVQLTATKQYMNTEESVYKAMEPEEDGLKDIAYYLQKQGDFPAYTDTEVTYFPLGEDKWKDMLVELERAKEFIFLEYFIVASGSVMWNSVLDILKRKVKEGVEVRIMYDGTCQVLTMPYSYPKKLQAFGIDTKVYAPIRPMLSTHQNNRDHRKILVIDGKVGYTGGINLADEYINQKELYGHWKDVAIKLEGDAVKSLTIMFLQLWNMGKNPRHENYEKYLKNPRNELKAAELGFIIPYGDDATNSEDIAENVYMDIINKAEQYVHIMTPYLVIDNGMLSALTFAAKKGIDVSIILPHIPDKKIPWRIAKTYYPILIQAGVKIYEYTPGFVHAKMFVSDDVRGVVGTINLDYRSLYHHFECGALIFKNPVLTDLEQDFIQTREKCQLITMKEYKQIPLRERFMGKVLKLYGPLI